MAERRKAFSTTLFLPALALIAFWPVIRSHPLMDDHLFFSWLEETPWRKAIEMRAKGNWIPYFSQMQMYRPFAGVLQVVMYHLFGTSWPVYHGVNLALHLFTALLAGLLTQRLTKNNTAGWLCTGLLLLHPRAAYGIGLIYNFYDPLVACLMLVALNCLWSLKRTKSSRGMTYLIGLWGSVAWSLGSKEVALPIVPALILADVFWKNSKAGARSLLLRHSVPVVSALLYLAARTYYIGHPYHTHDNGATFPLPVHSREWAFAWDVILLGICSVLAFCSIRYRSWQSRLPAQFPWMVLWTGLMLLPAVHFCAEVTLRPWFFDQRYWYVPLVPLCILATTLLTQDNAISTTLGSVVLMFTLPLPWGAVVGVITLVALGPLGLLNQHREIMRMVGTCYAIALAVLLWVENRALAARAAEAAGVHREIAKLVAEVPSDHSVVLLNFNEDTVEPKSSFNGDLQWLLKPPFFSQDLDNRFFFAYPTWDPPPSSNRFYDRTSCRLVGEAESQQLADIYFWDTASRVFLYSGTRSTGMVEQGQKRTRLEGTVTSFQDGGTRWTSQELNFNATQRSYLWFKVLLDELEIRQTTIVLRWLAEACRGSYPVSLPLSLSECRPQDQVRPATLTLVFPIGNCVDWSFAERVMELSIATPKAVKVLEVELASTERACLESGAVLTHYRFPEKRFLEIGKSRVFIQP